MDWINLQVPWNQTALMGVSVGHYAEKLSAMTEAQVIQDAQDAMFTLFPQGRSMQGLTLLDTFVQRWQVDEHARGAYSFIQLGAKRDEYKEMKKPEGKLRFAGEHTLGDYRGTVHGAYFSGIREATRVLLS